MSRSTKFIAVVAGLLVLVILGILGVWAIASGLQITYSHSVQPVYLNNILTQAIVDGAPLSVVRDLANDNPWTIDQPRSDGLGVLELCLYRSRCDLIEYFFPIVSDPFKPVDDGVGAVNILERAVRRAFIASDYDILKCVLTAAKDVPGFEKAFRDATRVAHEIGDMDIIEILNQSVN